MIIKGPKMTLIHQEQLIKREILKIQRESILILICPRKSLLESEEMLPPAPGI